jgi:hypothetical protein
MISRWSLSPARRVRALAAFTALALVAALAPAGPAAAEDSGFWYGADSGGPGPSNGSAPYDMPSCGSGHAYGGYIGKIGGADLVSSSNSTGYGPGNTFAWVSQYAADANANHFNYNRGVGAGGYWFMFGPNNTDGTGLSPYNWGQRQAQWALDDWQRWYANGTHRMPLRILWMDVEVPGSYGWGSNGAANRSVFNGFWDAVNGANQGLVPGVYSTRYQWDTIMAGNTSIPNTWEWTAQTSRASDPTPCPNNFSASDISAVFFGGQTSSSAKAAMWQWSLGNADYDQIDANKSLPD